MMVVIQFCFASVPDLRPTGAEPILRPILSCIPRCVRGKRQAIILQKPSHFHGLKEQVSRVCGCLEASSDITANKHTARFPAGRPISPPNQRHPFYRPCHTPNILFQYEACPHAFVLQCFCTAAINVRGGGRRGRGRDGIDLLRQQ